MTKYEEFFNKRTGVYIYIANLLLFVMATMRCDEHKDQINQLRRENLESESTDSIIETNDCAHLCHPITYIICES